MILKVRGLVIRVRNVSENDKYVTILTEEYGKIMFRASGVRTFKSKNLVTTQLFSYCEFTLLKNDNFIKLNEADAIETFFDIRLNLVNLSLANYILEIASDIITDQRDEDGVLSLLLNTLYVLNKDKVNHKIVKGVFEMRLLSKTGFSPNLYSCEFCDKTEFGQQLFFDVLGGNVVCSECINAQTQQTKHLIRISSDILNSLKYVVNARNERIFSFTLHSDIIDEFCDICEKYLIAQTDLMPPSLRFYKNCL